MVDDTKIDFLAALNPKERKLVQEIADGAGFTLAMMRAGYAQSTCGKQQARTRDKPRIKRALLQVYHQRGYFLTPEELKMIGKRALKK